MQNNLFRKNWKIKMFSLLGRNIQMQMQHQIMRITMGRILVIRPREKQMVSEKNQEMGSTEDWTIRTRIRMLIFHLWKITLKMEILLLNAVKRISKWVEMIVRVPTILLISKSKISRIESWDLTMIITSWIALMSIIVN